MSRRPPPAAALSAAPRRHRGFTLVELLVVLVIVALAAGATTLAMRDGEDTRLAREGARLAAQLEAARAESRASGVAVRFALVAPPSHGYRFEGVPAALVPSGDWLDPDVRARLERLAPDGAAVPGPAPAALLLGPEPLLEPARVVLRLGVRQLAVACLGLEPCRVDDARPDGG